MKIISIILLLITFSAAHAQTYYFSGEKDFPKQGYGQFTELDLILNVNESTVLFCLINGESGQLKTKQFFQKEGQLLFQENKEVGAITSSNFHFSNNENRFRLTWSHRKRNFISRYYGPLGLLRHKGEFVESLPEEFEKFCFENL